METRSRLFVYGTLRRGYGMDTFLRGSQWLGSAQVRGALFDLGRYPALTLDGGETIHGELWSCTSETLRRLDTYEGVSEGLFERVRVSIGGDPCWTYVAGARLRHALTDAKRVPSGSWAPPAKTGPP